MGKTIFNATIALVLIFLIAPILAITVESFSGGPLFSFPPSDFTTQWYLSMSPAYVESLQVSLLVAAGTTVIAVLAGVPAALALVRGNLPKSRLLSAVFLSPLLTPFLIIGVAALQFAYVVSDTVHIRLLESVPGLIFSHTAFTLPFVVRAVIAGQVQSDPSIEEAAVNLGASPLRIFFTVILPLLYPAVISGAVFAFLMSFDDVPVSLFVGGGHSTPLPILILSDIQFSLRPQILAFCSIVAWATILLVVFCGRLFGFERFTGAQHS